MPSEIKQVMYTYLRWLELQSRIHLIYSRNLPWTGSGPTLLGGVRGRLSGFLWARNLSGGLKEQLDCELQEFGPKYFQIVGKIILELDLPNLGIKRK